jgi:hypothetical protein
MENVKKTFYILNLSGSLMSEIGDYFSRKNIVVIDPIENQKSFEWTHILTKDVQDFSLISKTYKTIEKDIKIISLSKVSNPQNFILCNGKLILDEIWFKGPFGNFILDKLFLESGDLNLDKNYPRFTEVGAFNVVNPFSTGDCLDRLVQNAFDGDFSALSVRTYFDHLLMFLTGLKAKEKVGLPFDVSYGSFESVFALQIHFYAKGVTLEDILGSFSSKISKKAEEYLLYIAVESVDFFDLTYIPQVEKIVITSLWTKDQRVEVENRGFLLTSLSSQDEVHSTEFFGVTSNLIKSQEIKDHSEKVKIPSKVDLESEDLGNLNVSEELSKKLSGEMNLENIKNIFTNNQVLEDENKIIVGSPEDLTEMINKVKGIASSPEGITRIKGGKLDVDNFVQKISGGLPLKKDENWKVKSFGVGNAIKSKLSDFAVRIGKKPEDLSDLEISNFNKLILPQVLTEQVEVNSENVSSMMGYLKTNLDKSLKDQFLVDSSQDLFESIKTSEDEQRLKSVLIESLKTLLNKNFSLSSKDSLSDADKSILVKSLSKLLSIDEDKIKDILASASSQSQAIPTLPAPETEREKELNHQLKLVTSENNSLKDKIKTLGSEVRIIKESRQKILDLQTQVKNDLASLPSSDQSLEEGSLVTLLKNKLEKSKRSNSEDVQELSVFLEKAKSKEKDFRQLDLELKQKDTILFQEVERMNRVLKTKEMMVEKAKESIVQISEKKDLIINDLKLRLDSLGSVASQTSSQNSQIKELEKQNQNYVKMIEMYKTKISTLAGQNVGDKAGQENYKQEIKKYELLNSQLRSQVESIKKELMKYQEKVSLDNNQLTQLRADKQRLELEMKKLVLASKKDNTGTSTAENNLIENELKKTLLKNQTLEMQLKEAGNKLREVEKKLSEALKNPVKQVNSEDAVKKAVQLEANMKKLSQDLIESKNQYAELKKELNKVKQDKTSLQNQIDKMKKDQGKPSPSGPAKKTKAA